MCSIKWKERLEQSVDEYRPITFWSWNAELEESLLRRQISEMKQAGMGGFFMHARSGLKTAYMEDSWFDAVEVSMDEAKKMNMQAWCYDENGWPSGFAGMKLLEEKDNWAHYITFEEKEYFDDTALAVYSLEQNQLIRLQSQKENISTYYTIYDHTNSSVVDILNESVVRAFIELTHEKYYERYGSDFGNRLIGFFTDEPQYFRYDTAYSPVLNRLYQEKYHEDILDNLAALFLDCEDCYRFRYRYWKLMNDQFVMSFAKQIYDWCEQHNCKLTGHAIEESTLYMQMWCCAGVMPFYEYEHIPGCDWLGRNISTELAPRQVSSVGQQLGKKQAITESFACTGWDVTLRELKRILDWQYVNGINLLCTHLTPYSLEGSRKYDHPTFFGKVSPWFEQFSVFSDYAAKLGCMLSESKEYAPVGVIHPMHSAYLTYQRRKDFYSVEKLERNFKNLIEQMGAENIPHHYIDETLLSRYGKVCGNMLRVGLCQYECIVIPEMLQLDQTTVCLLKEYVENGGKLWMAGECPSYVNGELADLSYLQSNICFEDLKSDLYSVETQSCSIRSTYRMHENGDFIYLVNLDEEQTADMTVHIQAMGVIRLFLEDNHYENIQYTVEDGAVYVPLSLKAGETAILILCEEPPSKQRMFKETKVMFTDPVLVSCDHNSLPLDYVQLSYDNITYMEPMPIPCATDYLLSQCENREVYLKYNFSVSQFPESLILETEKMNIREITLNGKMIKLEDAGILDAHFISGNILPYVNLGENSLILQIDYHQKEYVYDVLYRMPDVTESILNCLTYDTEISAVYLHGNFGICTAEELQHPEERLYVIDSDISIGKTCMPIMSNMTKSGYPFFAGKVVFEIEAEVDNPDSLQLHLDGRYASAKLIWNEYETDIVLSEHVVIPSKYVKHNNKITVILFSGNRNLLGPHHWFDELEPKSVNPMFFNMNKSWKDGRSELYRESYSLVSFGAELKVEE